MPLLGTRGGGSIRGFGTFGLPPLAPPTVIGQEYAGGFYAGLISTTSDGNATHYLVLSPRSLGTRTSTRWKNTLTATAGTGSLFDGWANTNNMNNADHPAAQFCSDLSFSGYGDWYLPSLYELEIIYYNLKPTNTINTTSYGANPYSVPQRLSNYTTSDPAQTLILAFQFDGSQGFGANAYWSSTQSSSTDAWAINFDTGEQGSVPKAAELDVRAIRRVAIN